MPKDQVAIVRAYLETPEGSRRVLTLMTGCGLGFHRALCVVVSEQLHTDLAEVIEAVVTAIVS